MRRSLVNWISPLEADIIGTLVSCQAGSGYSIASSHAHATSDLLTATVTVGDPRLGFLMKQETRFLLR
jgi:hypothetical protein